MDALVSFLTRRRDGAIASRDLELTTEALHFGRGTGNEVELPGPGVMLKEGVLHKRPGGLFFESAKQGSVVVDDKVVRTAPVGIGSRIQLGGYDVIILNPPPGKDVAVSVELTRPLDDTLETLKARSVTSLQDIGVSKRRWAWISALVVLLLFFAWPLVDTYLLEPEIRYDNPMEVATEREPWPIAADVAWVSGEISGPHKFVAKHCNVCHETPFVQVRNAVCLSCHETTGHHVDPVKMPVSGITDVGCQACHKEHEGVQHIVRNDQAFCAGCHDNLKQWAPQTTLANVGHFGKDHPQFSPAVVVDPRTLRTERMVLEKAAWPKENSGLTFPHKKHLVAEGIIVPGQKDRKVLDCGNCHMPEPRGLGFAPISMQRDCMGCHLLNFEPTAPARTLPHGQPAEVQLILKEFYGDLALRGGAVMEEAPAIVRRRPGTQLTESERLEALAWADRKSAEAGERIFSKSVCGACHTVTKAEVAGRPQWDIVPVVLADRWMPKGRFDHVRHLAQDCGTCHAARASETASDVLLPQIQTCQNCHGGERAEQKVPSTCITCHDFHFANQPRMTAPGQRPPHRAAPRAASTP